MGDLSSEEIHLASKDCLECLQLGNKMFIRATLRFQLSAVKGDCHKETRKTKRAGKNTGGRGNFIQHWQGMQISLTTISSV